MARPYDRIIGSHPRGRRRRRLCARANAHIAADRCGIDANCAAGRAYQPAANRRADRCAGNAHKLTANHHADDRAHKPAAKRHAYQRAPD